MDTPSEFLIRSKIGVFRMADERHICGNRSYRGTANGFRCTLAFNTRTMEYDVSLISENEGWGSAETTTSGKCSSFDGMLFDIGTWMDSVCPEDVISDGDRDVKYFETSNGKIAYYAYNTELGGTPVIMVHGGPGGDSNTERARLMKLDRPIYQYDQLGCGRSDKIPDLSKWDDRSYVNELREFIDGMGFEKVIFISASWGAGLSAEYAIETKCEKVALLILVSPFLSSQRWTDDQNENMKSLPIEFQKEMEQYHKDKDDSKRVNVMKEYYRRFLFARPCNSEIAVAAAEEPFNDVFLALWGPDDLECTGTLKDYDLIPRLNEIKVSTLLMCCDSDEVTIPTMVEYRDRIEKSRISIIPNAGHALSFEQFDVYRQTVVDFLKENGY